ncbi:MAG: hypothetical protein H7328_00725 [Bdellovibrio sp.]|nr:hypothetical protein [Bdellovibrio sp.]
MQLLTFVISLFIGLNSFAQEKPADPSFANGACGVHITNYCSEVREPKESFMCLKQHEADLSVECKQEIERWVQVNRQSLRRGGGSLNSFGGMNALGPTSRGASYESRFGNSTTFLNQQRLNLSTPIGSISGGLLGVSLAGGNLHIGESVFLDSGIQIPKELYRAEIGLQYFKILSDKDNWGIRASIGYNGDEVFKRSSDTSFSVNAYFSFPPSGSGFWIATIFLANNSFLGNYIPIPGVLYFYKTPTFTGIFGFPIVSAQWTPVNPWAFGISIFGPTITMEANYGSVDTYQFFTNLGYAQQNFILRDRVNDKDRLTIEEKKLAFGVRTPVLGFIGAEIQIANAFDRQIYIGEGLFKKQGGSAKFDSDWLGSIALRAAF